MTVEEYCTYVDVNAEKALKTENEREKEMIQKAFDLGRRSVVMEIADYFGLAHSYEEIDRILHKIEVLPI